MMRYAAIIEARKPSRGPYVYHMTSSRNLPVIQKTGLRPPRLSKAQTNWGGTMGIRSATKVFFGGDAATAQYYGDIVRHGIDQYGMTHTYFAMLRVLISKLPDLVQDRESDRPNAKVVPNEFYVQRTVPARDIEIEWGEHGWYRLIDRNVAGLAAGEWDDLKDDYYDDDNDEDLVEAEMPSGQWNATLGAIFADNVADDELEAELAYHKGQIVLYRDRLADIITANARMLMLRYRDDQSTELVPRDSMKALR